MTRHDGLSHFPRKLGKVYSVVDNLQIKKKEIQEVIINKKEFSIHRTAAGWQSKNSYLREMQSLNRYLGTNGRKICLIMGKLFYS